VITNKIKILFLVIYLLLNNLFVLSQNKNQETTRILFIFDASYSMQGEWENGKKIDRAKELLESLLDSLKDVKNLEIGLRLYGDVYPSGDRRCDDTRLAIDFVPVNIIAERMKNDLKNLSAKGTTPLARSLQEGAEDFKEKGDGRNIIMLITDGKEACDGDPCEVSKELTKQGIIVRPFVIRVGKDNNTNIATSLGCIGEFFDAQREDDFLKILKMCISFIVDKTTTQINLLNEKGDPLETNINLSFYNNETGIIKYNYVHRIGVDGNPDTMQIDPLVSSYKIVAHTIPPVIRDSIIIKPGTHNPFALKTPQGKLKVKMNNRNKDYNFIVKQEGIDTILNIQEVNYTEDYLCGTYEVELLSIPRRKATITVGQDSTSIWEAPTPSSVTIQLPSKGYGGVYYYREKNNNWEQVYHFRGNKNQHKLQLLDGNYKVVYRSRSAKNYIYTTTYKDRKNENKLWFKLKEGESKLIKL
jgi:Ca-activated chloride channel family protein